MRGMTKTPCILVSGTPNDVATAVAIDDAAFALYAEVGITVDFGDDHPLLAAEENAWRGCAAQGGLVFADTKADGARVGFFALSAAEGAGYLEQIAVLPSHMRQGIGGQLMTEAIAMARRRGHQDLVLTTYDHVPWNRPYYERLGFVTIPADRVGPTVQGDLDKQRRYLPMPDRRIAMRLAL